MDSLWLNSKTEENSYSKLEKDLECDVCIVGAGVFGITCGYYLSKQGYKVTILEKDYVGSKTTGHTTGKITSQHGLFYNYLVESLGLDYAKDYLNANEKAINDIKSIVDKENIDCDFEFQNNYLYTTNKSEVDRLKSEMDSINSLGFDCEFTTNIELPINVAGSIYFKNQAQFNVIKYIDGLCKVITDNNGEIYTNTTVTDVKKDGENHNVYANDKIVKSKYVIIASHYPFLNIPGFYFTKMYQETSYLIAVNTQSILFDGMYINFSDPIFSYRTAYYNGNKVLLVGGSGHKTGFSSTYDNTYRVLEKQARKLYSDCQILFRWDTNDCVSLDKIPYIGEYSKLMPNVFVGTGFKKWGMTLSNVAANIIVDKITKKDNEYSYLFTSTRVKPIKNHKELKNVLIQSTDSLLVNKLKSTDTKISQINKDSGAIVEFDKTKIGVYKNEKGEIFAVKPICTHLGCLLAWNNTDKTWDCPCHGSRFDYLGKNLDDPAYKNLETYDVSDD